MPGNRPSRLSWPFPISCQTRLPASPGQCRTHHRPIRAWNQAPLFLRGQPAAFAGGAPYSYDNSNQVNSQPGASYSCDANGNLASKSDSNGTTTYAWDFEDRPASVTLPGSGGTVTFQNDPFGRKIEKISPGGRKHSGNPLLHRRGRRAERPGSGHHGRPEV